MVVVAMSRRRVAASRSAVVSPAAAVTDATMTDAAVSPAAAAIDVVASRPARLPPRSVVRKLPPAAASRSAVVSPAAAVTDATVTDAAVSPAAAAIGVVASRPVRLPPRSVAAVRKHSSTIVCRSRGSYGPRQEQALESEKASACIRGFFYLEPIRKSRSAAGWPGFVTATNRG
jgi:hypothetical protein